MGSDLVIDGTTVDRDRDKGNGTPKSMLVTLGKIGVKSPHASRSLTEKPRIRRNA